MTYQQQEVSIFAVLADPTRQAMLDLLRRRPMRVGEIAEKLPVSRPAVSQHLKVLKQAQLVDERREGTRHYFSLSPAGFGSLREYVDSMWNDALNAFAAYVDEKKRDEKKKSSRNGKE